MPESPEIAGSRTSRLSGYGMEQCSDRRAKKGLA